MNVASADEAAHIVDRVFDGQTLGLVSPLVYAHLAAPSDRTHRRRLLTANAPQLVQVPPVRLVRYPPRTLVDGDRSYLVLAGDYFVREQIAPGITDLAVNGQWMTAQASSAVEINAPCLLVARYGEITWGHWIIEILVKAVIAEHAYPGRFRYVVPACVTEKTVDRSYSTAVLESLSAYGISPERLIRLRPESVYRFASLFDVTGLSPNRPHPQALKGLQDIATPLPARPDQRRIAALRRRPEARAVFNLAAVESLVERWRFSATNLTDMSYLEQVSAFRSADIVVGSLGSNLTGLVFARPEISVVTLGPAGWQDGYFTPILQHQRAFHADLRGPSTQLETVDISKSPHIVDPRRLAEALTAVTKRPQLAEFEIDGEMIPRELGPVVLAISFGDNGNAAGFTADGWSAPETVHQWSTGPRCTINLAPGALPLGCIWLAVDGIGHVVEPYMQVRPLKISLNGVRVGTFDVSGRVRLLCKLQIDHHTSSTQMVLSFDHPLHPSPSSMGTGDDCRQLGFGFEALTFHRISQEAD